MRQSEKCKKLIIFAVKNRFYFSFHNAFFFSKDWQYVISSVETHKVSPKLKQTIQSLGVTDVHGDVLKCYYLDIFSLIKLILVFNNS